MHLYEDIKAEIIGNLKEKRLHPEEVDYYNAIISVFKSVKAKGELIAKERKVNVDNDIMFESIKKEIKELEQTINTTPENSKLHKTAMLQYNAIKKYAPTMISGERLKQGIEEILAQYNFDNFGQAMKFVMNEYKHNAEPKDIVQILKTLM